MDFERLINASKTYVFRKSVPAGESGFIEHSLVAHGTVENVKIRFAAGENGTLRIRPVVIIPQEIMIDLFTYAEGGDKYISGDDETVSSSVRYEIENNAVLRVFYENHGEPGSADSQVNVDIEVTYFQITEPRNIIG
ncbi:hypothetical protein [Sinanaerobacter chloroacetimidivorans]|uniref:Uncharacterized protein n=1 Tax=Sinanaerobacter chloroacetimidivorans TaxID=2818044 RepID=A0A8J7VWZ8_9FIRM|nr:hypothetical protein [Sinanaerobacter chloroacetimidivorans]MBR0596597.1 hypothetical protein [Sinanaerobacter chloroacetimidivorans]